MSRDCAVFTIVKNEDFFLPLWLKHYSRFFDSKDIYILDHDSDSMAAKQIQQIIDNRSATVVPVHWDYIFNHDWLRWTVNRFHSFLLQSYKKILFVEVDELIVTRNGSPYRDLRDYIDRFEGPIARTTGYSVLHYPALGEGPIDTKKPLLAQRSYWYHPASTCKITGKFVDWYDKPLLTSVAVQYEGGFHYMNSHEDVPSDPDLLLLHLHEIDVEANYNRRMRKDKRKFDPHCGPDFHNNPLSYEQLHYLRTRLPFPSAALIPEDQKSLL